MREAVIVSYARTGLAKSVRGGFNITHGAVLAGHAIEHAIARAKVDPAEIEDCILGVGFPEGATGHNIGRNAAIWAGCPVTTAGQTVSRYCGSGLQALAAAARYVTAEGADVVAAGGVESISLVQHGRQLDTRFFTAEKLMRIRPDLWMPMIDTADIVAQRYGVSREAQDEYAVRSQKLTAEAQAAGVFKDEIVPLAVKMKQVDKATGAESIVDHTVERDETNRPETTLQVLAGLPPVRGPGNSVTAGNSSQFADGGAALIVMEAKAAEKRGLEPLGRFMGFAVAGCGPDEMGVGPVYAVPRLLERHGLKVEDIDLWELNEAFASQTVYCRDQLHIPLERFNVNGGSISIGHPYGMTGARLSGHVLMEGRRRKARRAVATMCIGGGMGAAGLFEVY
jgi:acetyl-CoA C-acetyltransferase